MVGRHTYGKTETGDGQTDLGLVVGRHTYGKTETGDGQTDRPSGRQTYKREDRDR